MAILMEASKYLSAVNILLVLGLIYVYAKNFVRARSGFTAGLLIFAFIFLVQNAVCLYFSLTMMPYYVEGVEGYLVALAAMQTLAFAVMNYITWK